MRMLKLVPMFALFILLGDPVLFVAGQAYAACCICGMCSSRCTCPGVGNCSWCDRPDSQSFQSNAPTDNATLDLRVVRQPLPFTVTKSDATRLMELRKRVRGNFAVRLLGNVEDGLKFECFDENNIEDNSLAFQMKPDKES